MNNIILASIYIKFDCYPENFEKETKDLFTKNEINVKVSSPVCGGKEQGYDGYLVELLITGTEEQYEDNKFMEKFAKVLSKAIQNGEYLYNEIPF